jgi:hypothetical protein
MVLSSIRRPREENGGGHSIKPQIPWKQPPEV